MYDSIIWCIALFDRSAVCKNDWNSFWKDFTVNFTGIYECFNPCVTLHPLVDAVVDIGRKDWRKCVYLLQDQHLS